ncbi:MAG TPA: YqaJ viral recombinase family protein [Xanthomonadales bacterium]|nr:YqaJ viral recombinase family protein [Xanthomonadales bacterium]
MQTNKTQDAETQAIIHKVWSIIDRLPQRGAIVEADARAWVDEVVGRYGDLAVWHATRAGGFGGSQIGALVRNFAGQRADHEQSAHDIVAGALLRKTPDEPNGHMRRGIAFEQMHRRWFHEKYGARRDEDGFKTLSEGVGAKPWMRYSPDDLVFVPAARPGEPMLRKLIDYKAPSQVDQSQSVSFQYVCQLHMGRLVCESNGVRVDGMQLSQFDWANWQLKDDDVALVPGLDDLLVQAGEHYWAFVLRGEIPPYVHKERLPDERAMQEMLNEPAGRLAYLKSIVSVLGKKVKEVEREVLPALEKVRFGAARLKLDGISYSASAVFDEEQIRALVPHKLTEEQLASVPLKGGATKRYDEDAMLAALRERQVDVKQFLKPGNLDAEVLYQVLTDAGIDADALMTEQLRSSVDKKLGEQVSAWVDRTFADLFTKPVVQAEELVQAAQAVVIEHEQGEPPRFPANDRTGHQSSRYVLRSVNA